MSTAFASAQPIQRAGSMAFAIIGGLLVGTLLILVFLPTLYGTVLGGEDESDQKSTPNKIPGTTPGMTAGETLPA